MKMTIYSVMLEGIDASLGYFINAEVAAPDPTIAAEVAGKRAQEVGLEIVGVEEITETDQTSSVGPEVFSMSGKSYFPIQ